MAGEFFIPILRYGKKLRLYIFLFGDAAERSNDVLAKAVKKTGKEIVKTAGSIGGFVSDRLIKVNITLLFTFNKAFVEHPFENSGNSGIGVAIIENFNYVGGLLGTRVTPEDIHDFLFQSTEHFTLGITVIVTIHILRL